MKKILYCAVVFATLSFHSCSTTSEAVKTDEYVNNEIQQKEMVYYVDGKIINNNFSEDTYNNAYSIIHDLEQKKIIISTTKKEYEKSEEYEKSKESYKQLKNDTAFENSSDQKNTGINYFTTSRLQLAQSYDFSDKVVLTLLRPSQSCKFLMLSNDDNYNDTSPTPLIVANGSGVATSFERPLPILNELSLYAGDGLNAEIKNDFNGRVTVNFYSKINYEGQTRSFIMTENQRIGLGKLWLNGMKPLSCWVKKY